MNKNRNKKRNTTVFLSIFLSMMLILLSLTSSLSVAATADKQQENEEPPNISAFILEAERQASQENERVLSYLKLQNTKRSSFTGYPDNYAASYINDYGKLVIVLTEKSDSLENSLKEVAQNTDLQFEYADFSYEELTHTMNVISNALEKKIQNKKSKAVTDNICDYIEGAALLDDKNKIEVSIKNLDSEKINAFKNEISSSTAIQFKEASTENQDDAGVSPGGRINTLSFPM